LNILIETRDLPKINEYKYFDFPQFKIELLVWNRDGIFRIYSSFCPHFGGPLAIVNGQLHCYFHDYQFNVDTGICINKEFGGKCYEFDYFLESGGLLVEIS
jgi:nitrite reductase/ring-hydroxylating ferredoxin subunit